MTLAIISRQLCKIYQIDKEILDCNNVNSNKF